MTPTERLTRALLDLAAEAGFSKASIERSARRVGVHTRAITCSLRGTA